MYPFNMQVSPRQSLALSALLASPITRAIVLGTYRGLATPLHSVPTWPPCGFLNTPNRFLSKDLRTRCSFSADPLLQAHAWVAPAFCPGLCSDGSSWGMAATLTLSKGVPIIRSPLSWGPHLHHAPLPRITSAACGLTPLLGLGQPLSLHTLRDSRDCILPLLYP